MRKFLVLMIAAALCAGLAVAASAYSPGDPDGNGDLTAADARFVLRCSASLEELSEAQFVACDTDRDGVLSSSDARNILRAAASIEELDPGFTGRGEYDGDGVLVLDLPTDPAYLRLLCLNTSRRVSADVDKQISLSYVAGTSERMEEEAAGWYNAMYSAARQDGYYLTPCSGYRSYSSQQYLFNQFVSEYLSAGYSREDSIALASTRRMPAGSSEHNVGLCMDIIVAASASHFENYAEYRWLTANAADYGFILRYPEDKVNITGVKFEPWHWRYVGVDYALRIRDSGLCLEEYLGFADYE